MDLRRVGQLFRLSDVVLGKDGEYYSLPTLRAMHRAGTLPADHPAYMPLLTALRAAPEQHAHPMA